MLLWAPLFQVSSLQIIMRRRERPIITPPTLGAPHLIPSTFTCEFLCCLSSFSAGLIIILIFQGFLWLFASVMSSVTGKNNVWLQRRHPPTGQRVADRSIMILNEFTVCGILVKREPLMLFDATFLFQLWSGGLGSQGPKETWCQRAMLLI